MNKAPDILIVLAAVSMVVGVMSRLTMIPIAGIFASAFLTFAGVCLLMAIALILRGKK